MSDIHTHEMDGQLYQIDHEAKTVSLKTATGFQNTGTGPHGYQRFIKKLIEYKESEYLKRLRESAPPLVVRDTDGNVDEVISEAIPESVPDIESQEDVKVSFKKKLSDKK